MRKELDEQQTGYAKTMLLKGMKPKEISKPLNVRNESIRKLRSQMKKERIL